MMTHTAGRGVLLATAALVAVLLVACGGDDDPTSTPTPIVAATQTSSPTHTAQATPTPSVEDEVAAAYLAYWDAYGEAVLNLDASLVQGFAAGEELQSIRDEIEQLEADGVALRVVVEHDFLVIPTSEMTATVVDEVTNNSFYVDPVTKDPPEAEGSGDVLRDTVFMEKVDGRWVAVRSQRDRSE